MNTIGGSTYDNCLQAIFCEKSFNLVYKAFQTMFLFKRGVLNRRNSKGIIVFAIIFSKKILENLNKNNPWIILSWESIIKFRLLKVKFINQYNNTIDLSPIKNTSKLIR